MRNGQKIHSINALLLASVGFLHVTLVKCLFQLIFGDALFLSDLHPEVLLFFSTIAGMANSVLYKQVYNAFPKRQKLIAILTLTFLIVEDDKTTETPDDVVYKYTAPVEYFQEPLI